MTHTASPLTTPSFHPTHRRTALAAIIGYVATHIDEIKEKQAIATERTMKKQASGALDGWVDG